MSSRFLRLSVCFAALSYAAVIQASPIKGTIKGTDATPGSGPDDINFASTIDITFFAACAFITDGLTNAYSAYAAKTVFAGIGPVGEHFAPIDPGDFTISQYKPWVVTSNATTNNITTPSNHNVNRGVTNQDVGGANIIISYTPLNASDPTMVNFVQAFIENTNNQGFTTGKIDTPSSSGTPYYNDGGVAGTDETLQSGNGMKMIPLVTNSTTAAWLADDPYRCENGPIPPGASPNCQLGTDETILSQIQTFQTFIESDQMYNGATYHVLYGGVQWGYTYTNVDIPEPSVAFMFGLIFVAVGLRRCCRYGGGKAEKPAL